MTGSHPYAISTLELAERMLRVILWGFWCYWSLHSQGVPKGQNGMASTDLAQIHKVHIFPNTLYV